MTSTPVPMTPMPALVFEADVRKSASTRRWRRIRLVVRVESGCEGSGVMLMDWDWECSASRREIWCLMNGDCKGEREAV